MGAKSVTIRDVANKAGVSVSTVSKVFNNYDDVNESTRAKVKKAGEELNYNPDGAEKSLPRDDNKRIGLFIEDYKKDSTSEFFVYEIMMGFKQNILQYGYEVVLLPTTTSDQKQRPISELVSSYNLKGVFFLGLKLNDPYYDEMKAGSFPCVLYDMPINREKAGSVGVDSLKGARMATEHLLELGHRKIAFVNGYKEAFVCNERLNGYFLALNRFDVPINKELIYESDFTEDGAKRAIQAILKRDDSITAVFAASDLMAVGVIKYLNSIGRKVPDDVSVVGFDDINIASLITPGLTTIKQDRFEIGASAAILLLNLISCRNLHNVLLEPQLVIRESTARASNSAN